LITNKKKYVKPFQNSSVIFFKTLNTVCAGSMFKTFYFFLQ